MVFSMRQSTKAASYGFERDILESCFNQPAVRGRLGVKLVNDSEPLLRNISDTARCAAMYRARETDRPDAVFRDPFARRLAGSRGQEIADSMPFSERQSWAWVARTYLFDEFIGQTSGTGMR